jgi:hypothetical protein
MCILYSIFYSRGREKERENSTKSEAWACCERESEVKGERKIVNAEMERTASNK